MNLDTDYSKMPSTKAEGNRSYRRVEGDGDDFRPELIQTIFAVFNYCPEIFVSVQTILPTCFPTGTTARGLFGTNELMRSLIG